jgi:hypothetical protein
MEAQTQSTKDKGGAAVQEDLATKLTSPKQAHNRTPSDSNGM